MNIQWDLTKLYKDISDTEIQKDIEISIKENKKFATKWKKNKNYLKDPNVLFNAITEYEQLQQKYGQCTKPSYYLSLLNSLNQTDTEVKAKLNNIYEISTKLENEVQFFELSISKIPQSRQKLFLNSPILKNYKHYLETLFLASKYLLSDKEEKVFNITSKTSYSNWADMLSELLDKQKLIVKDDEFTTKTISYNEIGKYLNSPKKEIRDYASKQFNRINKKYFEIAEFEINSILGYKKISDEYRKIPRPDLSRYIADDIDVDIVDTLASVVTEHFDISKRYYTYKAKTLGQKSIKYYERNVPLGPINLEYTYEESMNLVKNSFEKIDPLFSSIVDSFDKNSQYDVMPKSGKTGGAFCISVGKNYPIYILLNHTNRLNDVLTIAHESGHGIHSKLSSVQSELNNGYPTSLAEVASTFFENFTLEQILMNANEKDKIAILNQKVMNDISSIFRQIAFLNFEKELHSQFRSKGYLNKEYISDLYIKHMKSYMGDSVEADDSMKYGWIYVGHFRKFFYVYSYACGLLISKALNSLIKEDKKNVELLKQFLSSGSTKSPKEIFANMGIDITNREFWMKGIREIEQDLLDLDSN
ncbi:MAG TPA: M3 family oligoendopeptidase [Candidatus Dojkabacteria bacterium]|nr:M3 family oligoendopeptidase [Candidatus Dojkabacteria bacterium]